MLPYICNYRINYIIISRNRMGDVLQDAIQQAKWLCTSLHFSAVHDVEKCFPLFIDAYLKHTMVKRMKYDIKGTINSCRHIFFFIGNNKYLFTLYKYFFFSVKILAHIVPLISQYLFFWQPCVKSFFSPWIWHLKRKRIFMSMCWDFLLKYMSRIEYFFR